MNHTAVYAFHCTLVQKLSSEYTDSSYTYTDEVSGNIFLEHPVGEGFRCDGTDQTCEGVMKMLGY